MQPPPSPTRTYQRHGPGIPSSASSFPSTLPTSAHGDVSTAASAALQGATLAFNSQAKTIAREHTGHRPAPPKPPSKKPSIGIGSGSGSERVRGSTGASAAKEARSDGDSGALLAATQAAREHAASRLRSAESPGSSGSSVRHTTGASTNGSGQDEPRLPAKAGSQAHGGLVAQRLAELPVGGRNTDSGALLSPPSRKRGLDHAKRLSTSPSLIAATLAASRSPSPVRNPSPPPGVRSGSAARSRGHSVGAASVTANPIASPLGVARRLPETPDTASIPPTTSLVSLFENKKDGYDGDPVKRKAPSLRIKSPDTEEEPSPEQHQQPPKAQKVKPKPKSKPKPKPKRESTSENRSPGLAETADESIQKGRHITGGRKSGQDDGGDRAAASLTPATGSPHRNRQRPAVTKPKPSTVEQPSKPKSTVASSDASPKLDFPQPRELIQASRITSRTAPGLTSDTLTVPEPNQRAALSNPEDVLPRTSHDSDQQVRVPRRLSESSASSDDTFVSASSAPSRAVSPTRKPEATHIPSPLARLRRRSSIRSLSTPDPPRPPPRNASTTSLPLNALTNAIVASNLASARLSVPTTPQPPAVPAPRRSGRTPGTGSPLVRQRTADSIINLRPQLTGGSRSPNRHQQQPPARTGMLQTLRSPHTPLSDDEDARRRATHRHHDDGNRRRRKALLGSNRKHAHHEGSRRRWRDAITPRERRRYEAVWASNRGLFLRPGWALTHHSTAATSNNPTEQGRAVDGPAADLVVNVVARDIFARSRLPADELAEVWDLVDRGAKGALGKEEFVVAVWLIDQRLRGRKIPARVGQSVWDSAGSGGSGGVGVVVPLPKGGGGGR